MDRYLGNAHEDGADTGGWFVGHFIDPAATGSRSTSAFEVKWCACQLGDRRTTPGHSKQGTTLVILVSGRLRLGFDDGEILLSRPADYSLWDGAVPHTWMAEADSIVITFRSPSIE